LYCGLFTPDSRTIATAEDRTREGFTQVGDGKPAPAPAVDVCELATDDVRCPDDDNEDRDAIVSCC